MDALRQIVRAAFRNGWRSWATLALLVAVVGGVSLGAAAAGRRTARAYPNFLRLHGFDWAVVTGAPTDMTALPGVTSSIETPSPLSGQPTCRCMHSINESALSVFSVQAHVLSQLVNLVSGRMPDPSNPREALASYTLQRDDGVHVGSVITVPLYELSQQQAVLDETGPGPNPLGPKVSLTVVGIEASAIEFPSGINPSGASATYDLYTSQAFAARVLPTVASYYTYYVDLRHPGAQSPKFKKAVAALGVLDAVRLDTPSALEVGAIHPQAVGWWMLALLAALAGAAIVGQAVSRQVLVESADNDTLAALGLSPRQLGAAALVPVGVVATAGAIGAVVVAYLVSPFAPAGVARSAEPSSGLFFDTPALLVGAAVIIVVVCMLAVWPALRAAGTRRHDVPSARPSAIGSRLSGAGAPPSMVIGVRHAFERGSRSASSPVATAILGTVLAVAALCGTGVFAASLSRLGADATLYGDDYQVIVYALNDASTIPQVERMPGIGALSIGTISPIEINHVFTTAFVTASLRGPVLFSVVEGALPTRPDQIALGAATMHQANVHIGSVVPVVMGRPSGGRRTVTLHVTGVVAFPTGVADDQAGLGDGADLSLSMFCPPGRPVERCPLVAHAQNSFALLVRVVPGPAGRRAVSHLEAAFPNQTVTPIAPNGYVNFGEAVDFPLIFGVMLALFGIATLMHLLVVSVSRRRSEVGLLKCLGFVRRQVVGTVYWQTATVAFVGLVIGTAVGIALGREVWIAFARNIGVVPVSVVDVLTTGLIVAGVVLAAAVLAATPAIAAARTRSGEVLRTQ